MSLVVMMELHEVSGMEKNGSVTISKKNRIQASSLEIAGTALLPYTVSEQILRLQQKKKLKLNSVKI